jgi:hypothetical protein
METLTMQNVPNERLHFTLGTPTVLLHFFVKMQLAE